MLKREYELIKKLGSGQQGSVWKAKNENGQTVALKIIDIKSLESEKFANLEVELLSKVSTPECSPFISCFYHTFIDGHKLYLEMEYIEGTSLKAYSKNLRDKLLYDILYRDLVLISKDILRGIEYLHSKNIIHRDIKPENIIITPEKFPKLVDLGLGCETKECQVFFVPIECCDGRVGTPYYMSPETILQKQNYFLSDIWSMGVTLYNSATGETLWPIYTIKEWIDAIKNKPVPKLVTENILLNKIVNNSVVKNIIERKRSDELLEMLKDV